MQQDFSVGYHIKISRFIPQQKIRNETCCGPHMITQLYILVWKQNKPANENTAQQDN
jgi:hypothetical protein